MRISKQTRREAKSLFRICLVNGRLDAGRVRQVLAGVQAARPRGYLGLLSAWAHLLKLEVQRRTARMESAVALGWAEQVRLEEELGKVYGPGLELSYGRNPALIGGVRLQVGSDVYDGSIQHRLQTLAGNL